MIRKNIQVTEIQDEFLSRINYETRISESEHIRRALDNYFSAWYGQNYNKKVSPMLNQRTLEIIEEAGKLPVCTIDNLEKLQSELKDAGYISYLDASTDYLIVEKQ